MKELTCLLSLMFFYLALIDQGLPTMGAEEANRAQEATAAVGQDNLNEVPDYQSDIPSEAGLNDYRSLESASSRVFATHPHAQHLKDTAEKREFFAIDPDKDPIIEYSRASVTNPKQVIASNIITEPGAKTYEIKICEESKPATKLICTQTLIEPTIEIIPATYYAFWCSMGNHAPDDPYCQAKTRYDPPRMYTPEKVKITSEAWTNNCTQLEERSNKGFCKLVKKTCPNGPETRDIAATDIGGQTEKRKGKIESRPITKDCWHYELEYACHFPAQNNCTPLRQQGCEQMDSECIQSIGQECVVWKQTFRCVNDIAQATSTPIDDRKVPSHTVDDDQALKYEANQELNHAIAQLSIFKEIQEDLGLNAAENNASNVIAQVFKGKDQRCTIHKVGGFSDCCQKFKGWGQGIGFAKCNAEEKQLAQDKEKGLCHEVGKFCAEKLPVVGCVRYKKTYCCYPSKLSRIIHEQGRSQLGISWGDPKAPQCRGLSVEELAALDFTRFDLSEIYSDIVTRIKEPNIVERSLNERVNHMTHGAKTPRKAF
ncbi:MAG: conjugal transfer protein TraN [Alphaproteobacteria bacterium]|nr:conjugal transfer protein TraN [Alphaproteobacteria bacterium]